MMLLMKRLLPLLLAFAMLLSACASVPEDTNSDTTVPNTEPSGTTVPSATQTDPPETTITPETTETFVPLPEGFENPLTGEVVADGVLHRPVAVMINNIKAAMPQHGVSQADIVFEVLAEGGITRCVGVFSNLTEVEKIGSIRSARKYFVDLALAYNAAYVHAGGSEEANNYLAGLANMNLDAGLSATHFYRDQDRLSAGYSLEHTLFGSGEDILAFAKTQGVSTAIDLDKSYNMVFDDETIIAGSSANKLTVYFNMGGNPGSYTKSTAFTYDEKTGLYTAAQHGGDYIDGNTDETVAFRNLLVLYAVTSSRENSTLLTIQTTGSGTGHFACNGQLVNINWSRESAKDPFTFTLKNGSPLTLGVGTSYIAIVPTGATVTAE